VVRVLGPPDSPWMNRKKSYLVTVFVAHEKIFVVMADDETED
jgi:hypothetical protein